MKFEMLYLPKVSSAYYHTTLSKCSMSKMRSHFLRSYFFCLFSCEGKSCNIDVNTSFQKIHYFQFVRYGQNKSWETENRERTNNSFFQILNSEHPLFLHNYSHGYNIVASSPLLMHTESDENGLAIRKKFQVCMPSRGPIQHLLDSLILFL